MTTSAAPVPSSSPAPTQEDSPSCFIDPLGNDLIRRELHGPDHLEAIARQLAEASVLGPPGQRGQPLLRQFVTLGQKLKHAQRQIHEAFRRQESTGPETEWLLDNFFIVEESLREVRQDLPQGYYAKLPKLASGPLAGYPRVYALGLALIAYTDSGLDEGQILRFVQAYQSVTPLTIGELWAVPIMLRLAVLENLRRLAQHILQAWQERQRAAELLERIERAVAQHGPDASSSMTEEKAWQLFFRSRPLSASASFLVHLLRLLRDHAVLGKVGIGWLEKELAQQGTDSDQLLRRESQRQAADQVCVGNCVTSLRILSALDWSVFFEKVSLVESMLREDPAGIYSRQDFTTRDRYRRVIEKLARGSKVQELDIARQAIERARASKEDSGPAVRAHVGYYLLGGGRPQLTAAIAYRPGLKDRVLDTIRQNPLGVYFGAMGAFTALFLVLVLAVALQLSASVPVLLLLAVAVLLPASEMAIGVVNYLVTVLLPPRVLPKMDFKDGIPAEFATCVVMPSMLTHPDSAAGLVDRLEVHYLANLDQHLFFALLTDLGDAPAEHLPADEPCVQAALEGIRRLNQEYCAGGPDRFFLFHRQRTWNASEGRWMGWERKRGKLLDFNRLLRGRPESSITVRSGELPFPIRFVITLDTDTQLPRETAVRLVGTLAHPLNQPRFDPAQGRVIEGYGILQPRVNINLPASARSLFARIFSTSAGIDPYTTAVSDVYQDLFGLGSFTGKGIYDVDAFEAAVGDRFPENTILSHDLIEGNFARCGLVSDIQMLDDFPARYNVFARREHRWVRGDWQILPWLFGRMKDEGGRMKKERDRRGENTPQPTTSASSFILHPSSFPGNPLPLLERWKIFDNLRRSLVPAGLLFLLLLGWTVLPGSPWLWTMAALLVAAWPLVLHGVDRLRGLLLGRPFLETVREWQAELPSTAGHVLLSVVFLVDQARLFVDGCVRTLYRLFVSRRHLLEWETAASTELRLGFGAAHYYRTMWPTLLLTLAGAGLVLLVQPAALPAAAPLLLVWLASPLVAFWISRPRQVAEARLRPQDHRDLRLLARKTWSFFETFVGEQDHFLPPDNYQENPDPKVAHRTSPTNVGLLLLSTLAARDFGYLSLSRMLERLEKTVDTLEKLERYRGHFHNWYDTLTLRSLQPVFISTVDSGNLLGCLLTLKQGLLEIRAQPLLGSLRDGLADLLRLAGQALDRLTSSKNPGPISAFRLIREDLHSLEKLLDEQPGNLTEWSKLLHQLEEQSGALLGRVGNLSTVLREPPASLLRWVQCFAEQVREQRAELAQTSRQGDKQENAPPEMLTVSACPELQQRCERLAGRAAQLAADMDFSLLYNPQRHLFAVGYNLMLGRLDNAHYDLLASEACLTSFLAVARGQAPRRHWFQLGRPLTRVAGQVALLSWGGTMFEYLMPRLLLHALPDTLLEQSLGAAVDRQIEYGRQQRVPWGISESGYSTVDAALDYQYQSFGVPGLGLRRGLDQDLVIAPYATILALMVRPQAALRNLRRLAEENAEGLYGFYEAVDYTPSRLPAARHSLVVHSYMAHHQGMGLVALANQLLGGPMLRRFHAEPMVRATELLLQERVPRNVPLLELPAGEAPSVTVPREVALPLSRYLKTPHTPHPRTHLLSNGAYTVMVTNAGGSWSFLRPNASSEPALTFDVTRWREDSTRDHWGQFCYVRDLRSGRLWSTGHQPLGVPADNYEVLFSPDKAELSRVDGPIETHLEVTVSPEHNCEIRRITLTNHDSRAHDLELTSYAEPVLAAHAADLAHPAFGKLFLETEFLPLPRALLCRRRPRSVDEKPLWGVHILVVEGKSLGNVQYETDRVRFLGRGRTPANPQALDAGVSLSGQTGAVLDPIFSLRQRVRVPAGASVSVAFTTAVAFSREEALNLADTYRDFHGITRAFELAWAYCQVELQQHHLTSEDVHLFQRLAAHLIYSGPFLRPAPAVLADNHQGTPALWRHGISGDKPIMLVKIVQAEELLLVRQLLLAQAYWRLKGLEVDLVILNQQATGYLEEVQQQLLNLVRTSSPHLPIDKPGGVFVRKADHIAGADQLLLEAAARVVLSGSDGLLASQLDQRERGGQTPGGTGQGLAGTVRLLATPARKSAHPLAILKQHALGYVEEVKQMLQTLVRRPAEEMDGHPAKRPAVKPEKTSGTRAPAGFTPPSSEHLHFANGSGGFTADGREYVITSGLSGGSLEQRPVRTPAPWINVVANASCGFLVSECGSGYSWAGNSQANRLTPWNNDPVSDAPSEIMYLRDETLGVVWPVLGLARQDVRTECRHGQGYSVFKQSTNGIDSELLLLVPLEDPVKLLCLKVRNPGGQTRQVSATFYAELVLGTLRDQAAMQVLCTIDTETGALLARNPFNADFTGRVAFADVSLRPRTVLADRTEFLGRNGNLDSPAALKRMGLSGRVEPGLDPCAALQASLELLPGQEREIVFILGEAADATAARLLVTRYREPGRVAATLAEVRRFWDQLLTTVQVRTPNPALDLLLNRWLLYQTLSCRILARSAFYQSGGAYGFRDQLQDVMALVYAAPQETRQHILRAASRQFVEGDVQHWWHPPTGRGVRTRFSDDFLWLPLAVCRYVNTTGDMAVLDEQVPFLKAPLLRPDQEEDYGLPQTAGETAAVYEHCVRAIEHGMRFGEHGLPLMGSGDWNDGMNRVGSGGKGETVWGGWFLLTILGDFAILAECRGDGERALRYRQEADRLHQAIEEHAWDGHWYRRAYFDDGTPLGSASSTECQIDSLPQSWAVLSGKAYPQRAREAMEWVERMLTKKRERLILLFTPPFDKGSQQPGYVRGYLPGIRENGGQYTHAATWVVQALALLGSGTRALEIFDLLNPILQATTPEDVQRYRVEPYVVAADVYSEPPHTGRGGWTWYTGAAGWLYRVALETILGFRVEGTRLRLTPCVPAGFRDYEITYRFRSTTYQIRVENPDGVERGVRLVELDGVAQERLEIALADDGRTHQVRVVLGGR